MRGHAHVALAEASRYLFALSQTECPIRPPEAVRRQKHREYRRRPRANRRPIKPIDSPAFHRSQISRPLGCWIIAVAAALSPALHLQGRDLVAGRRSPLDAGRHEEKKSACCVHLCPTFGRGYRPRSGSVHASMSATGPTRSRPALTPLTTAVRRLPSPARRPPRWIEGDLALMIAWIRDIALKAARWGA